MFIPNDRGPVDGAVACFVCGAQPILQAGRGYDNNGYGGSCRVVCPNYRDKAHTPDGSINLGIGERNFLFHSAKQAEEEGIPKAVEAWNKLQMEFRRTKK